MTALPADPATLDAYEALVAVIREWRQTGRMTTTAGLKPALQERMQGTFSEQGLGFPTFREFVQAAAEKGYIRLVQLPTRHWMALLPDEPVEAVLTTDTQLPTTAAKAATPTMTSSGGGGTVAPGMRLRSDVWQCLVDWAPDHRRLWDNGNNRGIMYPVGRDGRPAWESSPERFIEMPSADMATQIAWMREWAKTLTDQTTRDALLASLDDPSPGRFRNELNRLGLLSAWRAELQRRVLDLAIAWARQNGVNVRDLLDTRTRATAKPSANSELTRSTSETATPKSNDETAQLRVLLHLVIDLMPLAELASLPIKAEYLLRARG
ncbi:hypothetical protein E1258_07535 [Micromonospora sp. KC207]|uniref:hypothetical protein n=1 Tax=Micromonospora sp. KC207 TaxID=2530377 RepID=UPI00104B93AB|nr:hypothetical protein [Micromonospora sp. KC207]TDC64742.1 hypothetical protein E1258_07535 [Micromonospora sp. KC207]